MRARILVRSTAIAILLLGADWKDVTGTEAPAGAGASSPWAVPPDGSCNPQGGLRGWPIGTDAPPVPFQPGDVFDVQQIETLRAFIPPALWHHREKFFFQSLTGLPFAVKANRGAKAFADSASDTTVAVLEAVAAEIDDKADAPGTVLT